MVTSGLVLTMPLKISLVVCIVSPSFLVQTLFQTVQLCHYVISLTQDLLQNSGAFLVIIHSCVVFGA